MNENEVKALIDRFAKKQQDGHFACPRCGKMSMDTERVTRNALSRRVAVYICDVCGTQEATVNTEILLSLLTYIRGKRRMFLLRISFWQSFPGLESRTLTSGLTPAVISIIRRVSAKRQSLISSNSSMF